MANRIVPKRSSVAAKIPLAADLVVGELALNLADKILYSKDAGGNIISLGGGGGLPSQTSNSGKYLTTDGTNASWASITASTIGLGNVENKSSATIRSELTSTNVTTALGFTPYNATNPNGFISGITSGMVTTALGYTPYNSSNPNGYTTNTGTVTSVSGTGSVAGLTLSGSVTTSGSLSLSGTLSASIDNITDEHRLFNNMGDSHSTRTSFDAQGAAATVNFGWRYVQGSTNAPNVGNTGNNQYYSLYVGLGNEYAYNQYGMQVAIPRTSTTPYLSLRFQEGGAFGAWQKISAGYADSAGSLTSSNAWNRSTTAYGYIDFGPANSSWAHIYSDKSFYFNQELYVNGTQVVKNSGTWGISISGNAATATNADTLDGLHGDAYMRDDGWNTSPGQDANTQTGMRSDFSYSNNCPWTGDLIRFGSGGYSLQLSSSYTGTGLSFRTRNGDANSWNAWSTVIHSNNYTSYAPSLTGSGASGTWGINISGNAATTTRTSGVSGYTHAGTGMYAFYNWGGTGVGGAAPSDGSYTIGISVGSHPNDQAYGFQIARNMWADGLWTRGYDSSWRSWVRLLDSSNYTSYNSFGQLYASDWFRSTGSGGLYFENYGRGIWVSDAEYSYGNIGTYGGGRNGWRGFGIYPNNAILMADGSSWGVYNPQWGWMMSCNMSGSVTFGGSVTAYSDLRVKENVREIDNVIDRRDTLAKAAIKYEREGRTRIGYGAQTLRDNGCGEFVMEADDNMKLVTGLGTLSVDYGETTAVLAVASKMTDDRVASLEAKIEQLEAVIEKLLGDQK